MTLATLLTALYDSEINVTLSSFWDGGWRARLGDDWNGYKEPPIDADDLDALVPKLRAAALSTYPESHFARRDRGEAVVGRCTLVKV